MLSHYALSEGFEGSYGEEDGGGDCAYCHGKWQ